MNDLARYTCTRLQTAGGYLVVSTLSCIEALLGYQQHRILLEIFRACPYLSRLSCYRSPRYGVYRLNLVP
jgi:hypothetical protein